MSRSGYSEDCDDPLQCGRWQAQVQSALRGKRGQKFLFDLVTALEALPEKKLCYGDLENEEGAVCALGALGKHSGIELKSIDTDNWDQLGDTFNIARQLAQETMYVNDECGSKDDEQRWKTVRGWALRHLKNESLIGDQDLLVEP